MYHTEGKPGIYRIEELPNGLFYVYWYRSGLQETFKTLKDARRAALSHC